MEYDWRNPERVVPWKPRQRFQVTALGHEAVASYRSHMSTAQAAAGQREALEQAKQEWAAQYRVQPTDGFLLEDMAGGRTCLAELQETLDACGLSLRDARAALDRMRAAELVLPLEVPSRA
ncbi:MAG TPA: hypothetical protein VEY91_13040 [Candidatus Limnocylindria bacterium]|nr:hypothetical protein [Candidatus Limnocylindria bacterium]